MNGRIEVVLPDDPRPIDDGFIGHVFESHRGFEAYRPDMTFLATFSTLEQAQDALAALHSPSGEARE